jgi:polyisoprenoid-binding protein YceI
MPLVSQTFDQLLDFTRTTAATFVGSNGLIQNTPASVNLLTQTQQFDNAAWSKGNGAITANATTAPDGTATADSFVTTAATAATFVQATFTSLAQSYTASFYVKANGVQYIQLLWAGTQSVNIVNFDIVNGTIGTNTADAGSITAT